MRFKTRQIGEGKIFLVGQCPGKQRKGQKNHEVFHGNRTGDLIEEFIKTNQIDSLFMTNVFNYVVDKIHKEIIQKGLLELREDILRLKPYKIICLGKISYENVTKLVSELNLDIPVIKLPHPSYILRFNQNIENYLNELINQFNNG